MCLLPGVYGPARSLRAGHVTALLVLPCLVASAAAERSFDIPAGDAVVTLRLFAAQSGEQLVYPVDRVRGLRTQAVCGRFEPSLALETMLRGTELVVVKDRSTGALAVGRGDSAGAAHRKPNGTAAATPHSAQRPGTAGVASLEPDGEPIRLSPFEVRSTGDVGYRAANSIAATRAAAPLRDLPMSVTAFTQEFINDQKPYDLYDVVKWAPGVHQDNVSPQGWIRYNIRGFTSAAVQRNGFSSFRFVDTSNIDRVEVVRGPASLLYGQLNPGGVINYVTKRPERRAATSLGASAGSHGYTRLLVDATGPVAAAKDTLFYRAIAMREDIQEFHEDATGRKHLLAPSLQWNFSENAAVVVEYERFERREKMPASGTVLSYENATPTGPYPGLPWHFNYAGEGDYQNFTSDAFTAEFTAELAAHLNVRAIYLHSAWDMEWRATGQGAAGLIPQSFIDYYYGPATGLTSKDAMFRRNRWEHQTGGEQTAQVDVAGDYRIGPMRLRPLIGYKHAFRNRYESIQKNNPNIAGHPAYLPPWDLRNPATWSRAVPFGTDALVLAAQTKSRSSGSSLYGVLQVAALNERLHVLAGFARHELHNDPTEDFYRGLVTPATDRSASIPQAGVLYRLHSSLSAYASYSESFLANISMLNVNNVPTKLASPAEGRGWEAGLKFEFLQGAVSGTASAYRIQARPTGIVTVTTGTDANGTTLFTDIQGGEQQSDGFELELFATPHPGLQLMASCSWSDAVYTQHPTQRAFDGTRLVATPGHTFNLWAKFTPQSGVWKPFSISAGLNRVGSMTYVANNPLARFPAYTTVDVVFSHTFRAFGRRWSADLSIKNLLDEEYFVSAATKGYPRHALLSLTTRL